MIQILQPRLTPQLDKGDCNCYLSCSCCDNHDPQRPRPIEFFAVLSQVFNVQNKEVSVIPTAICDLLVRDTLARVVDCDLGSFQIALLNLSSFIEYVYFQDYSLDLINCTLLLVFKNLTL